MLKRLLPRLLLGFFLLSPVPLALLTWFSLQAFESSLRDTSLVNLSAIADKKVEQINSYLGERVQSGLTLSRLPLVRDALRKLHPGDDFSAMETPVYQKTERFFREALGAIVEDSWRIYDLKLVNTRGQVVFSFQHEADYGADLSGPAFSATGLARAHKEAVALMQAQTRIDRHYSPSGGVPAIFLVTPVFDDGELIGTVALQLDIEKFTAAASDHTGLGLTGETVLAQRDGDSVLYIAPLRRVRDAAFRYRSPFGAPATPIQRALLGDHGADSANDYADVAVLGAWRYLPILEMGMVVKMDASEVLAAARALRNFSLVGVGFLMSMAMLIAWLIGRDLLKPIRLLVQVTTGFANGDLERRASYDGVSEFQQLAQAFNLMAERLQASYLRYEGQLSALAIARDQADAASRAKNEFLASMSHELRTPLNATLGYAQLLNTDDSLPESVREQAQEIENAGRHLLSLVNDVIDLARIESGRLDLSLEAVPIAAVLAESFSLLTPLAQQHGIALRQNPESSAAVLIRADYVRLRQVVVNLLSNAIKYNRPKGQVTVRCECTTDKARLSVIDTGHGIPAAAQARLFTAFDRLGREAGSVEGTGIGLVITQRIVEAMGGTMGFSSLEGQGSTFWIEFPLAPAHAALDGEPLGAPPVTTAVAPPALPHTGADGATKTPRMRVLYVEDNPINRRLMAKIFSKRPDLELLEATTAEHGVAMALATPPALILMDINLPGMDGYQALALLKSDAATQHVPIIALTANAMKGDSDRGAAAGFDGYLTKPVDVAALWKTLDAWLTEN